MRLQELASVLIIEDKELMVFDVRETIRHMDLAMTGASPSRAGDADWLQTNRTDITMLDIGLRDGECAEVARVLHERGIPFIVRSANHRDPDCDDKILSRRRWLSKPSNPDDVIAALKEVFTYAGRS